MQGYDVIIIGAGHNGLVCAAYLGMAGLKVKVLERRGVVGGAAVTEEFHPGFRNSVAAYTVSLLNPKIIRDLRLHEHGLRIVERRAQNFLPAADGRYLLAAEGRTERELAKFSARDAERYGAFNRAARRLRGRAARSRARSAAERRSRRIARRARRTAQGRTARQAAAAAAGRGHARALRPVHQIGRRLSRRLVRGRSGQGAARLRRHRRQLREPVYARHRLCAAASCVRRGERQEARLGSRRRRHGRDHAGDGARGREPRRRDRDRRAGARGHRREGQGLRRGAGGRARASRRGGRRQCDAQAPLHRDDRARCARCGFPAPHAGAGAAAPAPSA